MSQSLSRRSGRAGRDGLPSRSILYYSKQDAKTFAWLINKTAKADEKKGCGATANKLESLESMIEYCVGDLPNKCRRAYLLGHFGERAKKVRIGARSVARTTPCSSLRSSLSQSFLVANTNLTSLSQLLCCKTCDYCQNEAATESLMQLALMPSKSSSATQVRA